VVAVAPTDVVVAASQARIRLLGVELQGEGFAQAVALSEKIALQEPLTRDDQLNLRSVLAREVTSDEMAVVHDLLGGDKAKQWAFHSAELPERPLARLSQRLTALDERLAERILGQLEAIFKAAVGRTALRVAKHCRAGKVEGCPVAFLDALHAEIVRAAISETEEAEVLGTISDLDELLPPILLAALAELRQILRDELDIEPAAERLLPEPVMLAAVEVARKSMVGLILGRLSRNDTETVTSVPPNIARDILHAAGGADTSAAGGIPKGNMGRVLVAGVEATGDGFATSQHVVDEIQTEGDAGQRVEAVRRWRHSGKPDAVPAHKRNDGKQDVNCDFSAGPPGGLRNCGCRWVTELEVVA